MLLYNVTSIIEDNAAQEWLKWMQGDHIPKIMDTGRFVSCRLLKVLDSPNEGVTYCVQFVAENMNDYQQYQLHDAPRLQAEVLQKFENRALAFGTIMEYIA